MFRRNDTNDTIFYKVRNGRCKLYRLIKKKTTFEVLIYNLHAVLFFFLLILRFQVDQEILTLHVAGESRSILHGCLPFL